ncbi:hypothetical protein, partial [uncultured Mucilaginibacter sp.]|uniref:hypothetical protein n=1 Tax=uncultured Mucilaginibacter sp. TaxID=797541 RepID=UPI0025F2F044
VDRTETAEDIAFEAEHGQTRPSAAFTQEVSDELYAQLLERDGDKMRAAGWYMGETVVEKSEDGSQMSEVRSWRTAVRVLMMTGFFRLLVIPIAIGTPTTAWVMWRMEALSVKSGVPACPAGGLSLK